MSAVIRFRMKSFRLQFQSDAAIKSHLNTMYSLNGMKQ